MSSAGSYPVSPRPRVSRNRSTGASGGKSKIRAVRVIGRNSSPTSASEAPVRRCTIEDLPDWTLPSNQMIGAASAARTLTSSAARTEAAPAATSSTAEGNRRRAEAHKPPSTNSSERPSTRCLPGEAFLDRSVNVASCRSGQRLRRQFRRRLCFDHL